MNDRTFTKRKSQQEIAALYQRAFNEQFLKYIRLNYPKEFGEDQEAPKTGAQDPTVLPDRPTAYQEYTTPSANEKMIFRNDVSRYMGAAMPGTDHSDSRLLNPAALGAFLEPLRYG